jgi:hemolysin activation/secretion protein
VVPPRLHQTSIGQVNPVNTAIERLRGTSTTSSKIALTAALLLCARAVEAAPPSPPASGGQLLQQVPTPPSTTPTAPAVTITRPEARTSASGEAFFVQKIEIDGNTTVPSEEIRKLVAPSEGKKLTLADLQKLANSITDLYHKKGFPFSQAYVPAQAVQDGRVKITILEARYDSIVLRNKSRAHDYVAQAALSGLKVGMPVDQDSLDRALLLTSDIPSTQVKGTLRPGQTPGSSQLIVDVDPGPIANGSVMADDYGNAATGRARLGANINLDNPLRAGDVLSVSALTAGRGMNYGRMGYDLPIHGPATQIEAHVSTLDYKVVNGSESALDALGTATVAGLGAQQDLLRTTRANVVGTLAYEQTWLHDEVDVADIHTNRRTEDWRAGASGSVNDRSGVTSFNAGMTFGHVVFDDATARLIDDSSARIGGQFTKYDFSVSRLQALTERTALYGSLAYQGADKNLDVSEQFFVGGPMSIRAYDNGIASGSQGNSQMLELRHDFLDGAYGHWQGTAFLDHAQIQLEKSRYSTGPNTVNLSDIGAGLNWTAMRGWSVMSSLATPLGGTSEVIGHRGSVRFWAQVQKLF